MFLSPCAEFCWRLYNRQYTPEYCDTQCDYGRACKENNELKKKVKELETKLNQIKIN